MIYIICYFTPEEFICQQKKPKLIQRFDFRILL